MAKLLPFKRRARLNEQATERVLRDIFIAQAQKDVETVIDLAMLGHEYDHPLSVQKYGSLLAEHRQKKSDIATTATSLPTRDIFVPASYGSLKGVRQKLDEDFSQAVRHQIDEGQAGYSRARAFAIASNTTDVVDYCVKEWLRDAGNQGVLLAAMPAMAVGDSVCLEFRRAEYILSDMGIKAEELGAKLRMKAQDVLERPLPDNIYPAGSGQRPVFKTDILRFL